MKKSSESAECPSRADDGARIHGRSKENSALLKAVKDRSRLLLYFRRHLGSEADAEDAVQEFYAKIVRHSDQLEHAASADGWVRTVLRNTLTDQYRRRAARRQAMSGVARESIVTRHDRAEESALACLCMHQLLPALSAEHADVLRRADLLGQPRGDIARELGISPGNVSVRIHRARRALKERLQANCPSCMTNGFLDCHCKTEGKSDHRRG